MKPLTVKVLKRAGRGDRGQITVRHKNSGLRRNLKKIFFKLGIFKPFGLCVGVNYDSLRSARVALIKYAAGFYTYVLATQGVFFGRFVKFVS